MRSIIALTVIAATGGLLVVENLPEGEATADAITHGERIESISIDGGPGLPLAQLREAMTTKLGSTVERAGLAQDRATLEITLASRGYLAAKVSDPVVTFGPTGGVYVVFDVERGPLFHIRRVTLEGTGWSDAGVVTIAAGDDALADRLDRARLAAQETLQRHGRHLAVALELASDPAQALVDVRLVLVTPTFQ